MGHESDLPCLILSPSAPSYLPVSLSDRNSLSKSPPALPIEPLYTPTPTPTGSGTGSLSLHHYRKSLSCGHGNIPNLLDGFSQPKEKTLRRKNAATNLTAQAQMGSLYQHHQHNAYSHSQPQPYQPFAAASSVTSSSPPPPLSPSYSPSALSEQSELSVPLSPILDGYAALNDKNYKLLDTFRDRLEKFPDPETPDIVELYGHSRTRSDSVLFKTRRARKSPATATATVVHQGTSFEILNPHESLDFARIVSYIEDVDCHSASVHQRDSYFHGSDDADADVIVEEEARDETPAPNANAEERVHDDLVGDSPHRPIPSISSRLDDPDTESCYSSIRPPSRPLSMVVQPWSAHDEPDLDIGEPGPPIYDNDHEDSPVPGPSTQSQPQIHSPSPNLHLNPAELAALYNIRTLPPQNKGTDNPTAVIYSDLKPLRKRSTIKKKQSRNLNSRGRKLPASTSSFSFAPSSSASTAGATASAPLKRLRGIAQTLRRKTFQRTSLSS